MVLGEEPPVPRDKRTEVYAMAKVQKASRTYIGLPLRRLSHGRTRKLQKCGPLNANLENFLGPWACREFKRIPADCWRNGDVTLRQKLVRMVVRNQSGDD